MKRDKIIRLCVTALTLALTAALIASAVALYLGGLARREAMQSAAAPLFNREDAARALRRLAPLALAWLAAVAAGLVCGARSRYFGGPRAEKRPRTVMKGQPETRGRVALRAALYAAAALLLVLGALNGGLNDVLVKAINICTECIGLG